MTSIPDRQIRAVFDSDTIRVYQAYSHLVADSALAHGTFVAPAFKMERMTWIKPSFLWMMYRAGWGLKEGQVRILAIDITRAGFEWALTHSCLTHPTEAMSEPLWRKLKERSPVRIQWDPERDLLHRPLRHRSLQVGLGQHAVPLYVDQWIRRITDVTALANCVHQLVLAQRLDEASSHLPAERPYLLPADTAAHIGASQ